MKPELLDGARRLALVGLGTALDQAGVEGVDRERVQDGVMGLFDALLIAVEATSLPRVAETNIVQFAFATIWPIVRAHLGPALVADPRTARRFREALEQRRPSDRCTGDFMPSGESPACLGRVPRWLRGRAS